MADGLLVEFDPSTMIAGLISGKWWTKTGPDYEEGDGHGKKTNLMWRTICRGVGDVIAACGLDPSKVVLCVEVSRLPCHMTPNPIGLSPHVYVGCWQFICIPQEARGGGERDAESEELFRKMLQSASTYIAMCSFTFVPLEEVGVKVRYPEQLPGVEQRGRHGARDLVLEAADEVVVIFARKVPVARQVLGGTAHVADRRDARRLALGAVKVAHLLVGGLGEHGVDEDGE